MSKVPALGVGLVGGVAVASGRTPSHKKILKFDNSAVQYSTSAEGVSGA